METVTGGISGPSSSSAVATASGHTTRNSQTAPRQDTNAAPPTNFSVRVLGHSGRILDTARQGYEGLRKMLRKIQTLHVLWFSLDLDPAFYITYNTISTLPPAERCPSKLEAGCLDVTLALSRYLSGFRSANRDMATRLRCARVVADSCSRLRMAVFLNLQMRRLESACSFSLRPSKPRASSQGPSNDSPAVGNTNRPTGSHRGSACEDGSSLKLARLGLCPCGGQQLDISKGQTSGLFHS